MHGRVADEIEHGDFTRCADRGTDLVRVLHNDAVTPYGHIGRRDGTLMTTAQASMTGVKIDVGESDFRNEIALQSYP
jgi:hypothetical protein